MSYVLLLFIRILTVFVTCGTSGKEAASFPLDSCFTTEMDVLFLYFNIDNIHKLYRQKALSQQFIHYLLEFHSSKTTSRVMFADIIDTFPVFKPHLNVSSWNFHTLNESRLYGFYKQGINKQQYLNVQQTIEMKVKFVKRLFSEMDGVRKNVTHIGVIFLDGSVLSYEESKSVPRIVQQLGTGVKIFVVVVGSSHATHLIQMNVTLFVEQSTDVNLQHILTLTMCNQCMVGWFKFEHNDVTNSISCYKLFDSKEMTNWYGSFQKCAEQNADLSAIETTEELTFLQTKLFSYFTHLENFNDSNHQTSGYLNAQVFIGLQRVLSTPYKRFHWIISKPIQVRPLVINRWMSGHPSLSQSNRCVAWQFVRYDLCNNSKQNDQCNTTGSSSDKKSFVDGWVDIPCETLTRSFSLCEITLHRGINDKNLLRIKPATNESFNRALNNGEFTNFKGNIVSITANIESQDFQLFLKQSGIEFPLFDCGEGEDNPRYISYVYVCDYTDHCRNRRDETFCNFSQKMTCDLYVCSKFCNGVMCSDGNCLPLQFVNDGEIDCFLYGNDLEKEVHDESQTIIYSNNRNKTCVFYCNGNKCVSLDQLNDGRTDCFGPEGPLDETIGKLQTSDTCVNSLGHSIWAPVCVYVEDVYGAVLGCRDKSHLHNCTDFECPDGYLKCPDTYCIPQHYVLDGKSDCPTGEDEQRDIISPCSGNFACWNSQICLHPDLVCNRHPDCPYKDDEFDCNKSCPKGFRCISGTAKVLKNNKSISLENGHEFGKIKYIDFSDVDLSTTNTLHFVPFSKPIVIVASNCKLNDSSLYYLSSLLEVRELDASYNLIQNLNAKSVTHSLFRRIRHLNLSNNNKLVVIKHLQMTYLETLDLSHTALTDIDGSFLRLPNLRYLNLSFTFITEIHNGYFSNFILQTLDLRGLTMKNVRVDMFNGLTVRQDLYTDSFELCCPQIRRNNIPHYTCHGPVDAISSCFDLIGNNIQRILLWVIAGFSVLGNITVIGYRVIWDTSVIKTGYGLFVTNLGISDFIMGVYLFIIAGADYYYHNIYVLYDKIWRESVTCKVAGFLATLSSETSIFFIFFITLDRFLMMKFPFGQRKFTKLSKVISVILSWIFGFIIAMFPTAFNFEIYSSNAVCLGLPLTTKRVKGWEFSFGVFIVLNFLMCLLITYGQRAIFRAMSESRITEAQSSTCSQRAQNITVAKQLTLVAMTNVLCWFPVGLMGLFALYDHVIRQEMYAWITVIVLPISSTANPLLYTIPALMARWKKFKNGEANTQRKHS